MKKYNRTAKSKKKSAPKGKSSNLKFGLTQENKVRRMIINQNGGECESMQNRRQPHDLLHTSEDGNITAIQVKASRAKSKNTNTCSKAEKERLRKLGKDNNIDTGYIQKKGEWVKYTSVHKRK